MTNKNGKQTPEFSKRLLRAAALFTLIVTAFTLYMIWVTRDLSPLMYLIPAVFAELATATGFYYTKAKAENKIKLMKAYGVDPSSSDFNT